MGDSSNNTAWDAAWDAAINEYKSIKIVKNEINELNNNAFISFIVSNDKLTDQYSQMVSLRAKNDMREKGQMRRLNKTLSSEKDDKVQKMINTHFTSEGVKSNHLEEVKSNNLEELMQFYEENDKAYINNNYPRLMKYIIDNYTIDDLNTKIEELKSEYNDSKLQNSNNRLKEGEYNKKLEELNSVERIRAAALNSKKIRCIIS
jgi:hypothetical protein